MSVWPFNRTKSATASPAMRSEELEEALKRILLLRADLTALESKFEKMESRLLSMQGKMYASLAKADTASSEERSASKSLNPEDAKYL